MSRQSAQDRNRRRRRLALYVAPPERCEDRAMITESLGLMLLGPAARLLREATLGASWESGAIRSAMPKAAAAAAIAKSSVAATTPAPQSTSPKKPTAALTNDAGFLDLTILAIRTPTAKPSATATGDWLKTRPKPVDALSAQAARPWTPASSFGGGGGGAMPGAGGFAAPAQRGQISPLNVPNGSSSANSLPNVSYPGSSATSSAGGSTLFAAQASHAPATGTNGSTPTTTPSGNSSPALRVAPSTAVGAPSGGTTTTAISNAAGLFSMPATTNSVSLGQFPYFPLYTLDYNDGSVLFPGFVQYATIGGYVDLRAQTSGTALATTGAFSWDTSGLAGATSITGAGTYDLKFQWLGDLGATGPYTSSTTLTVTDSLGRAETQTYTFVVPKGHYSGSGGTGSMTWADTALAPDAINPGTAAFATHNGDVPASTGAFETAIGLPSYNPNVPGLTLQYDSLAADPRPLVVVRHQLDPAQSIPSQVDAQLTFNGTSGGTSYYNTSQFIPGDVQQLALQADATGLSTGRYAYSATAADVRLTTTTETLSGTATVVSPSDAGGTAKYLGQGWSLAGLERVVSASGGVILDLGAGDALWFAAAGSGGGSYASPAGDFSTLVGVSGGGYQRTMPDGTVYTFNSSGQETAVADRDGRTTAFAYAGGELTTSTDPYGKVTTFSYSGGYLQSIDDPAGRLTTFTHSGATLTAVELPDTSAVTYAYDTSGRMTTLTDANSHSLKVAYDSAERVGTITRADSTTETFFADQERGFIAGTSSSSPGAATLLAQAAGVHVDPNGDETDLRPDWRGMGLTNQATDALGDVSTTDRDANGLATIAIDRLNRIDQYQYDSKANVTQHTYADFASTDNYAYNSDAQVTSFTDANIHQTTYAYSTDGHSDLIGVYQPAPGFGEATPVTTFTHNSTGQVLTSTDANGNTTSFAYDSQDRLTTITSPAAGGGTTSTATLVYDSQGDVVSSTDANGKTTTYSFDAAGRRTGTTDALGDVATQIYDSVGNLKVIEAPTPSGQTARTTTLAYDAMDRLTTITQALNSTSNAVTVLGYDAAGNPTTATDPMGRTSTTTYDALNRPTVVVEPLTGTTTRTTTTVYDAEGQVLNVTQPALSGTTNRVVTNTYNARGWVSTSQDPFGNLSTYTYSATGKTLTQSNPSGGGSGSGGSGNLGSFTYDALDRPVLASDALGHVTTTLYDAVGDVTSVQDPNGHTSSYAYDSRERLTTVTDALGHATVYGYDSGGNQISVTDANSNATTYQYDSLNRATTTIDARGDATVLTFDSAGRNTVVKDPNGNLTTFVYDAADRVVSKTTPTATGGTASATYAYDLDGELTATTDRDGRQTTYAYDSGGRTTGETWRNAGGTVTDTITYSYNVDAQMTGASDSNATVTITYDSGGRLASEATSGASGTQPLVTLTHGYDAFGNRTSTTDTLSGSGWSGQGVTSYAYDAAFRLTTDTQTFGGNAGPQVLFGYDPGNRLTSIDRTMGGSGTSVNSTYSYDSADRLTTIIDQAGTTGLATFAYGYDPGNRLSTANLTEVAGTTTYTYNATYAYDRADELIGVTATLNGSAANESYTFDSGGNRNATGYSTGGYNALTASPGYTYTYDNEGNQISKTQTSSGDVWTSTYDNRNRLTGVVEKTSGGTTLTQATYTYDALDRRIGIDDDSTQTWTVFDGSNPYADFTGSGTLATRYLSGAAVDEIFARTSASGTSAWYLTDNLGSVRDLVSSAGLIIDHLAYDSFGNITVETSPSSGDRYKYAGLHWDPSVGLYLAVERAYDPVAGRWTSQDPLSFGGGDQNIYRYVRNLATNLIDPSGLLYDDPPASPPKPGSPPDPGNIPQEGAPTATIPNITATIPPVTGMPPSNWGGNMARAAQAGSQRSALAAQKKKGGRYRGPLKPGEGIGQNGQVRPGHTGPMNPRPLKPGEGIGQNGHTRPGHTGPMNPRPLKPGEGIRPRRQ